MVISKWEFDVSREAEVRESARIMDDAMGMWPEIEFSYTVRAGEDYVIVVMGYRDEASYQRLIRDPSGPFEKAAAESGIE